MDILLSTSNAFKIKELKSILEQRGHKVFTLQDFGLKITVQEKGVTFFQNALVKAQAVAKYVNIPVLGDDSGLVVPALNGEPGVLSARYAGEVHNDIANTQLLLRRMEKISNRDAYMMSVLVLCYPDGHYIFGEGTVQGKITRVRRGMNGFGYDGVFFSNELGKTFGEANDIEKQSVSHRTRAVADLFKKL
jgi:non-canonical purine NTP pyrophosphatase, rdgB/HAM1 family